MGKRKDKILVRLTLFCCKFIFQFFSNKRQQSYFEATSSSIVEKK